MMTCVDVSTHQGEIDYNLLPCQVVIMRVGFGKLETQKDRYFERNYSEAKKYGKKIGVYLYSYAKTPQEAIEEAKTCLYWLNGRELNLPIFFDIEDKSVEKLHKDELTKIVLAFANYINSKSSYKVGVYANKYWLTTKLNTNEFDHLFIWCAQYNESLTYNGLCDIWQFTSKGNLSGIKGYCDLNYIINEKVIEDGFDYCEDGWGERGGLWYYIENKKYCVGWKLIDRRWYYFNNRGFAVTGLQELDGRYYYFSEYQKETIKECQLIMTDGNGGLISHL